jgi:hypothetical protein
LDGRFFGISRFMVSVYGICKKQAAYSKRGFP